jgi:4-hydroxy-tetrahydrodipicolinate synthase
VTGPAFHPTLPTAMHDDGSLDPDGQAACAAVAGAAGAAALVAVDVAGGELAMLDPDERARALAAAIRGAAGLPVLAGVLATEPAALLWAHRAAATGASGLVVAVGTGPGGEDALAAVAATGLPVWLHHHPAATGSDHTTEQVLGLAAAADVRGVVVEAPPTPDAIAAAVAAGLPAHGGLAGLLLPEDLAAGAAGATVGTAIPELIGAVLRAAGDRGACDDAHLTALPALRLEVGSAGLRVRKEAWRQRGVLSSGRTRRGTPLGPTTKRLVTSRLRDVGIEVRAPYPDA